MQLVHVEADDQFPPPAAAVQVKAEAAEAKPKNPMQMAARMRSFDAVRLKDFIIVCASPELEFHFSILDLDLAILEHCSELGAGELPAEVVGDIGGVVTCKPAGSPCGK